ncbi:Glycosyl transferases group 1 [Butyrivibrio sp. ob235]|uniref:glycosyltransferase n=1 Tax=Butyrivibrio sp. ob235 TaxID=1761780 RepID=UPI0008BC306C|nr:glycosyltransferase [Butyrivibrio sp. ob235]SEL73257.1 Glycosyl transferases group 1 [Butyrivibrio sp. ob235]
MSKIAIITPCLLPVPAIKGGAVERLITGIIDDNEKYNKFDIDLYCISDKNTNEFAFNKTHIINVYNDGVDKYIDKFTDSLYRRIPNVSSKRLLDKQIIKCFSARLQQLDGIYDAIVVQNVMSTALEIVEFCQGKYEIPIYFHMHNCVDVYRSPYYVKKLVQNGVQFIAVSEYIKKEILECDRNAVVHVLYNGVSLKNVQKKDVGEDAARKFLYSGRIIPGKGVKELVLAFGNFLDKLNLEEKREYRLDIIGFSDSLTLYERQVMNIAQKYSENICCLKKISADAILEKYYDYDVIVMPTKGMEPFGLVALETISRGIPLITTNSGALPEIVGAGAEIVDKSNNFVDNLEKSIWRLSHDNNLKKDIAEKGFARAREIDDFNLDKYYSNFISIINKENDTGVISIIVPVYNVEKYLDRCVDSIEKQIYRNLEVILVDDGSTDSSGDICDKYAKLDPRIKVIHQENQGLSAARNSGLEIAKGELVFFLDSDDYIEPETIESMAQKMVKDHADIVACGIKLTGDKNEIFTSSECGMWSGHEAVIQMMRTNNVCSVAWNKLYKRNLFNSIRFPAGMLHEDEATTYKLLYKAKLVSYTPETFYCYFQRSNGIMGEKISERSRHFIKAIQERIAFFDEQDEKDLVQHSRITLLDGIKYAYRNEKDVKRKKELLKMYQSNIGFGNAPEVMGVRKASALLLWKYLRY